MDKPFELMKSGKKTIEIRLNDEKRRQLNVGDEIEFTKISNSHEKLLAEVIELLHYPTFKYLIDNFGMEYYGYPANTDVDEFVESIYTIYKKEDEIKYGVLGIKLRLK